MIDVKFLRENPEIVKENIRKKFQDAKLPLVDEVIEYDEKRRTAQNEADQLRAERNKLSKQIGALMGQGKRDEAEEVKKQVAANAEKLAAGEARCEELEAQIKNRILETRDAIRFFIKEYDCLHRVMTPDGYLSVIDNILRGNVSYIKLVYEALDNYIALRDATKLIEGLDSAKLSISLSSSFE